jgi:hypothetical protein
MRARMGQHQDTDVQTTGWPHGSRIYLSQLPILGFTKVDASVPACKVASAGQAGNIMMLMPEQLFHRPAAQPPTWHCHTTLGLPVTVGRLLHAHSQPLASTGWKSHTPLAGSTMAGGLRTVYGTYPTMLCVHQGPTHPHRWYQKLALPVIGTHVWRFPGNAADPKPEPGQLVAPSQSCANSTASGVAHAWHMPMRTAHNPVMPQVPT